MKKLLDVRRGSNGVVRYFLNGKSLGIVKAVQLIKDYCTTETADDELCASVKVLENPKAKALYELTVKELSKIEWYKDRCESSEIMKPVYGGSGVEFVPDEVKNAEKAAQWGISSAIYDLKRVETDEQEQACLERLVKWAKKYPHIYLAKFEDEKWLLKEYADWSEYTGRPNVLEKLEKIAADIKFNTLIAALENESTENSKVVDIDDGSNDEPAEDFLTSCNAEISEDADIEDELVDAPATDENPVLLTVADQFAALELADDYYPNLNISGKLTKINGTLTAINKDGITVTICDDYLEITGENVKQRINYDIAENTFRAALQKVTMQAITEGKIQDTFEIVGKSGLIYTYTESTLKPVRTETPEQYNARINSTPKEIPTLDTVPAKVNELWQILRQKQQALKAIMAEENIVAARKYSVKIAEIKLIVDSINNFTKTAA